MPYTQHRTVPWDEVMGADGEKIFAFGALVVEHFSGIVPAGGSLEFYGAVVPAGEIWIITCALMGDWTTASPLLRIINTALDGNQALAQGTGIAQYDSLRWVGQTFVDAGHRIIMTASGGVGNNILASYMGYKMTIP